MSAESKSILVAVSEMDDLLYPDREGWVVRKFGAVFTRAVEKGYLSWFFRGKTAWEIVLWQSLGALADLEGDAPAVAVRMGVPLAHLPGCETLLVFHNGGPDVHVDRLMKSMPVVLSINYLTEKEEWLRNVLSSSATTTASV